MFLYANFVSACACISCRGACAFRRRTFCFRKPSLTPKCIVARTRSNSREGSFFRCEHETVDGDNVLQSKILLCNDKELPLTVIFHSFLLSGHGIEKLFVASHPVEVSECSALKKWLGWPDVNYSNYPEFMAFLETTFVCPGNPDRRFARKTRALKNRHGNPSVVLDTFPVCVNSVQDSKTVRSSKCQLVTLEARRCLQCRAARSLLRTHSACKKFASTSRFARNSYLATPQRSEKFLQLAKKSRAQSQTVRRLRLKIKKWAESHGIEVQKDLSDEIQTIVKEQSSNIESTFKEGTFQRLFWD